MAHLTLLRPHAALREGRATLVYQGDGNLVLEHDGRPVWASGPLVARPGVCQFQSDGNLVLYDADGAPYWHAGTHGHDGADCQLQSDGNLVIYHQGVPIWATGTILSPAPPQTERYQIYGNFLANGLERWGFMALAWWLYDRPRFDRFVRAYVQAGYRHLPVALYGAYPGEQWYDLSENPAAAGEALRALLDYGITPILMLVTDWPIDPNLPHHPDLDRAWADRTLRALLFRQSSLPAHEIEYCLGWEINQVAGYRDNPRQGHELIALARAIRQVTGRAPWLHLQPNWWAPHYEGGDEATWWHDVDDACCGLLAQIRPDAPLDLEGDPASPDGLYLMLRYPRQSDGARGIAGRLEAIGKRFVLFEHSRNLERWRQVERIVREDPRVVGIC